MTPPSGSASPPVPHRWPLIIAIVAIGLTLRGPIAALPPVLTEVAADLRLGSGTVGLLTSLPVLCFAIGSPIVVILARRLRVNTVVLFSLIVLAVAVAVRPWGGATLLLAGTVVMGLAMAVGNVLIPVVIRRDLPDTTGPTMSAFSSSLNLGAGLTAATTAPLALLLHWRGANAAWAFVPLLAALLWLRAARSTAPDPPVQRSTGSTGAVWRSPDAWWLAVFFGLQSAHYYTTTTWLPTILQDTAALSTGTAATAMSIFQLLSIVGTLAVPVIVTRTRSWRALAVGIAMLSALFTVGILVMPSSWLFWCVLGGVAQGGAVSLALTLIAVRAYDVSAAGPISAMVQTVGYLIGAAGPVAIGVVSSRTEGWTPTLVLMAVAMVVMGISGLRAGAAGPIGRVGTS